MIDIEGRATISTITLQDHSNKNGRRKPQNARFLSHCIERQIVLFLLMREVAKNARFQIA